MTKFFLGIDVGGTKSHALVADETGRALGLGASGAGNYEVVGYDGLTTTLNVITDKALRTAGINRSQLAGAGFGIAGYDWPAERQPTCAAIHTLGIAAPYKLVNDTIIGLLAGATAGWGVAVVAGTSCNCRGRDPQGREGRVTGGGPLLGEYGGAGEIVGKAVQAVSLAWTQRGPATRLTGAFVGLVGARNPAELIEGLALGRYRLAAAAAPTIFDVAGQGDEVAQGIVRWAGRELASLAIGVIRQLELQDLEFELVLTGGLFQGSETLIETMAKAVHVVAPKARFVRLAAPPVIGGVLLGMKRVGWDHNNVDVRQALIESTKALLKR
jgi:N-acetylglucosamine kinase-like BadF-type ATPase